MIITINLINHPTIDIESFNDMQNKFELESDKTCQYMFSEDFHTLLSSLEFNFSIMAVSETWFNSNTNINSYNIENYSLVHIL